MAETALHGRFLQEQKIIKAYADYIQYRVGFSDTELTSIVNAVSKLEGVLGHERIIKFNGLVLGNKPEAQLVKDVFDFLHQHETQLKKERNWIVHSCKRNTLGDEDELPNISYWRELAEYMLPFVSINQWDDVEAYLRDRALETIRANRNEYGEVFDRRAEIEGIDYSIRLAKQLALNQTFNNITFLLYKHEELEIAGRLSDPTSEICAYRQAFILLMTAFDATVFDLVRVALRKNFFGLISVIKNQEKISMDDFVDCKTFDDFVDVSYFL